MDHKHEYLLGLGIIHEREVGKYTFTDSYTSYMKNRLNKNLSEDKFVSELTKLTLDFIYDTMGMDGINIVKRDENEFLDMVYGIYHDIIRDDVDWNCFNLC